MPTPADGVQIVTAVEAAGTKVRMIGSLAIGLLSTLSMGERPSQPKDIDIVALSAEREHVQRVLAGLGWRLSPRSLLEADRREQYLDCEQILLDVFYDGIDGNHRIDLRSRLDLSFPTISWTDLLLSKLQRVSLRAADVWDVSALLESPGPRLDVARWQNILGRDWGLFTTVVDNLVRWSGKWPQDEVGTLIRTAERAAKTAAWRLRSVLGKRMRWWTPVYEE